MTSVGQISLRCVFLLALLVGCEFKGVEQPPEVEIDSNQDYSVRNPIDREIVEVTLVTFVEQQVPVPDRENVGKLILNNGCMSVQLEDSNLSYIPIFQNGARLVQESGEVIGVSVGQQHIRLNDTFRFSGAIVRGLEKIPEITSVPENCNHQFHSIGSVEL